MFGAGAEGIRPETLRHVTCSSIGMTKEELQQRSLEFSVAVRPICEIVGALPGGRNASEQLLACSSSAAANYRAACRARSRAEFIAKLGTAVEESDEAVFWLEYIERSGLRTRNQLEAHLDEARQLRAIFAASYGTARFNHNRTRNPRPPLGFRQRKPKKPGDP